MRARPDRRTPAAARRRGRCARVVHAACARLAIALSATGLVCTTPAALGQYPTPYPSRSVRIVVPFAVGGPNDFIGRVVAERLTERWKQIVLVENRAGAGGNIGTELVAKSPPDGYTLLLQSTALVVNARLSPTAGYDPETDFAPVTLAARSGLVFVTNPELPASTLADIVRLGRHRPLNYASPGNGTMGHLAGELLRQRADVDLVHIPYKGAGPTVSALVGGQVRFGITAVPPAIGLIRAGRLKAIAVTGATREPLMPEVPTASEAGFPKVVVDNLYGMLVPAGTPPAIVNALNEAIVSVLRTPDVRERLEAQGFTVVASRAEAFTAHLRDEAVKWAEIIRAGNVKAD